MGKRVGFNELHISRGIDNNETDYVTKMYADELVWAKLQ